MQAIRLALKENLQKVSDKYTALKQSRQERLVKANSEKVEEDEPTKDEKLDATIPESLLTEEDEQEFVGDNEDTIESVKKEATEKYLIEEPTPLMPLESVHFTPKNGVAFIVLQDTVKTKPLQITTLSAPPLPVKAPDPPSHPIVAQFPPPVPP
ncbi:hypothetical protein A2U01_0013462 [Trifolium medium]|uniref:Uncharacterized protein n=1 Tax=Trifolium medium TaxID=97028 RepID=A0A392MYX8_9FABA|nr:hypothetical protein [Trifolium medium]